MSGILPALLAGAVCEIAGVATLNAAAQGVIGNRADAAFTRVCSEIGSKLSANGNSESIDRTEFELAVTRAFQRSITEHIRTLSTQCRDFADRQLVEALEASIAEAKPELEIVPRELHSISLDGIAQPDHDIATNLGVVRAELAERVIDWCSLRARAEIAPHLADTFKSPTPSGAPSWLTVFRRQVSREITRSPVIERVIKSAAIEDILSLVIKTQDLVDGLDASVRNVGSTIVAVQDDLRSVRAFQSEHSLRLEHLENLIRTFRPREAQQNSLRALGYAMYGGGSEIRTTTLMSFEAWRTDEGVRYLTRMQRARLIDQFLELFSLSSPPGCVCVHHEGAEFDIIASNISSIPEISDICSLIEKICTKLDIANPSFETHKPVFGVATAPIHGTTPEAIARNTQFAFMRATESQNRIVIYDRSFQENARERAKLEEQLRHAIDNQEFRLHYQPQVDLEVGSIVAGEALLRWENPELGVVSPGKFIPLAEDTGLISTIEKWAISQACECPSSEHLAQLAA